MLGLVLVLAHWWAERGPGVWLQGPGVPELMSDCRWVGLVPDTADCGGSVCPDTCVGLLVGGARVQPVPGLVETRDSLKKRNNLGLLLFGWL